ncbi:hypothetical protein [Pleurocapsa sp. FMAR1]|uniref:hypothetical protein n=1 Tax=Pleurocapsa sp. FMAR1 TaxID=3040204 RepID=UPI0029C72B53|nr:hypothetical protein [Pleurocapsa sp. FMAR1]
MSLLGLRFRTVASRLQLLEYHHTDLAFEKVSTLVSTQLTNRWSKAIAHRQDPEDPYTVWSLLYLDAVINLEDWQGKFTRVGVFLTSHENRAYRILKQAQKPTFNQVRKSLKIYRYWVFCVEPKHFPSDGEWVDILYGEIDKPNREGSSRLIIL